MTDTEPARDPSAIAPRGPSNWRPPWGWLIPSFLLAMLAGWLFVPATVNGRLQRYVTIQLQAKLPNVTVSLQNTRYDPQVGLILEGLELKSRNDSRPRTLLRINELACRTRVNLQQLLTRPLQFDELIASGAEIWCWPESDHRWNLERLLIKGQSHAGCPRIRIVDGRVHLYASPTASQSLTDVEDLDVLIESSAQDHSLLLSVQGTGPRLRRLQGTFGLQPSSGQWHARYTVEHLELDGRCLTAGAKQLFPQLEPWAGWTGTIGLVGKHSGRERAEQHHDVRVDIVDGRYESSRLPFALEQTRGRLHLTGRQVAIQDLHANIQAAPCSVTGQVRFGEAGKAPEIDLRLSADRLVVAEKWSECLPDRERLLWDKWRPTGCLSLRGSVRSAAGHWEPDIAIRCHEVAVQCAKFPYDIEQISGDMVLQGKRIAAERMQGSIGGTTLDASFDSQFAANGLIRGFCELRTVGPIPIDNRLFTALSPRDAPDTRLQTFVEELRPSGGLQLIAGRWDFPGDGQALQRLSLQLVDGSLQWLAFPYPISRVNGRIEIDGKQLVIKGLEGQNAGASVRCDGTWQLGNGGDPFDLSFQASSLPLDEQLRSCLNAASREKWDALRPNGVVDQLHVQLRRQQQNDPIDLLVAADQSVRGVSSHHLQVKPPALPYQLEIERGQVRYAAGRVTIEGLRARHGQSLLVADGNCQQDQLGTWLLQIDLGVDSRIRFDTELMDALPPTVRALLYPLRLSAPLGVYGTTKWALPSAERPETAMAYDLTLLFEGNDLGDVGLVHDIRGRVTLQGDRTQGGTNLTGQLDLDSLFIKGVQVTRLRGPIAVRGDKALVGRLAVEDSASARSIEGSLFGGTIALDGALELASGTFGGGVRIADAKLAEALADLGHPDPSHQGSIAADVELNGQLGNLWLLRGSGNASLRDARLYQLPLVIRMLNQLRITPSVDAAFTRGDARFRVEADTLQLQSMRLMGELVSLDGSGTVTLQRELDLRFRTIVSPTSAWNRLTRNMRDTPYNLMVLEVVGTIDEPHVQRRGIPEVNRWGSRATEGVSRLQGAMRDMWGSDSTSER